MVRHHQAVVLSPIRIDSGSRISGALCVTWTIAQQDKLHAAEGKLVIYVQNDLGPTRVKLRRGDHRLSALLHGNR